MSSISRKLRKRKPVRKRWPLPLKGHPGSHPEICIEAVKHSADPYEYDVYITVDGKRIAYRGQPDSPQAKTWVSMEPGWVVFSTPDHEQITVEYRPEKVREH
jgi:hypothetical protein